MDKSIASHVRTYMIRSNEGQYITIQILQFVRKQPVTGLR